MKRKEDVILTAAVFSLVIISVILFAQVQECCRLIMKMDKILTGVISCGECSAVR